MKSIKVLLAKKKDNKYVSNIFKILDTKNYFFSNIKDINRYIREKNCYTALQNNKIIGAMVLRFEEKNCELFLLSSKKKGVGSTLVNFAIQKCAKDNIPKIWCYSLARYKVKGFYKKMGFKELFLLKKQFNGEDCYFFGREIKKMSRMEKFHRAHKIVTTRNVGRKDFLLA